MSSISVCHFAVCRLVTSPQWRHSYWMYAGVRHILRTCHILV